MMSRSYQDDALAAELCEKKFGLKFYPPMAGLIIEVEGKVAAVGIVNHYNHWSCHLTGFIDSPVPVSQARNVARYIFGTLKCRRITCVTHVENTKTVRLLRAFGFQLEGVLRSQFPSGDGYVFGLLADEQKLMRL